MHYKVEERANSHGRRGRAGRRRRNGKGPRGRLLRSSEVLVLGGEALIGWSFEVKGPIERLKEAGIRGQRGQTPRKYRARSAGHVYRGAQKGKK